MSGYTLANARAVFARAGGDPDNAIALAEWGDEVLHTRDMSIGVIVASDGRILADTKRQTGGVGASYVTTTYLPDTADLIGTEVAVAAATLRRITGRHTLHVTYSQVCTGAGAAIPAPVTPLEVAARRSLIGLSITDLATALDINEKTVRRWESPSGALPISAHNLDRLDALVAEHTADVDAAIAAGEVALGDRPYGWYSAVAARILDRDTVDERRPNLQ